MFWDLVNIMPALLYNRVQWVEWAGNVGQLIKKLVNLYKQKLIDRNNADSEKNFIGIYHVWQ